MNWIKCSERLPERDKEVLVFSEINGVTIDFITFQRSDGTIMFLNEGPHVTHWMELPKPPYKQVCNFCLNPDSIIEKNTCCTGCSILIEKENEKMK